MAHSLFAFHSGADYARRNDETRNAALLCRHRPHLVNAFGGAVAIDALLDLAAKHDE
jgi:hypothetical protein